ncbi:hypothetical protein HY945_05535 [Candidatus Gottesmanbacteria bacterium]|nr:hypothetical protein [Candidatus Gottesmanbacteria bacterium]
MNNRDIIVLYSGGTDSTLTAALMAERFEKVHLITYERFGIFSATNPVINVQKLKQKFGDDKFTHRIIREDRLFKYVSYERYLYNLVKYRFFLLSTCGLCKLSMHIRTIIFCLNNKIFNVCDGAHQDMRLFPDQMISVINEIRKMYAVFGIEYTNPVFDFEGPKNIDFVDKLHLEKILATESHDPIKKQSTTGYKLFQMGLMPLENVKGTELDHKMQPRCFQFILFNIFVLWNYFADHSYEEYEKRTLTFYKEKIGRFIGLLKEYTQKGRKSILFRLTEE